MFTIKEVAEILGVKSVTLRKWIKEGKGPRHVRIGNKFLRFRQADIDAWLDSASQTVNP